MKNIKLSLLVLFVVVGLIKTSEAQLFEAEGLSRIEGRLDIGNDQDLTTVNIGINAGLSTNYNDARNNTFTGYFAGFRNTTGSVNSFFGSNSGLANTTGVENSFFGYNAGLQNQTGRWNTIMGSQAGTGFVSGDFNVFVGQAAAFQSTGGSCNVIVGRSAGRMNNASHNTFIGAESGRLNTSGNNNTAVGDSALIRNTVGIGNTAVGQGSMQFNGDNRYNTAIGYKASFPTAIGSLQNTTCIGYNSGQVSLANNRIEIGNTSVSWIGGQVAWSTYSDARIKNRVKENVPGLSFINQLRPVTYHLDIHRQNEMCARGQMCADDWADKYLIEETQMTGFIAQEVEQAAQVVNYDFSGVHQANDDVGMFSLNYSSFVVPLVKAVQELSHKNELLEMQLQQQMELIAQLYESHAIEN